MQGCGEDGRRKYVCVGGTVSERRGRERGGGGHCGKLLLCKLILKVKISLKVVKSNIVQLL